MTAYYNEYDPYAAQWLRNLIAAGEIADGVVDERSIKDVRANDLKGFTQCHFFAGIGIWSKSLRDGGWADSRHVWTGSCPCQPFSAAGAGAGYNDERHLWPHFHELIAQCKPSVVIGEQVASKAGRTWFDLVSSDMEALDYAAGASDLCAAGYDGAHIRQRLYWLAVSQTGLGNTLSDGWVERWERSRATVQGERPERSGQHSRPEQSRELQGRPKRLGVTGGVADPDSSRRGQTRLQSIVSTEKNRKQTRTGSSHESEVLRPRSVELSSHGVADATSRSGGGRVAEDGQTVQPVGVERQLEKDSSRRGLLRNEDGQRHTEPRTSDTGSRTFNLGGRAVDWLLCRDGKWRPVEPATFPLAHAYPNRVGRLRAYGNGLDLETSTQFVLAVKDTLEDLQESFTP